MDSVLLAHNFANIGCFAKVTKLYSNREVYLSNAILVRIISGCVLRCYADPRQWSRDDVHSWLRQTALRFKMANDDVDTSRFMMNGKALCLMNLNMFLYRVPRGGDKLHDDFQRRLASAVLICQCH